MMTEMVRTVLATERDIWDDRLLVEPFSVKNLDRSGTVPLIHGYIDALLERGEVNGTSPRDLGVGYEDLSDRLIWSAQWYLMAFERRHRDTLSEMGHLDYTYYDFGTDFYVSRFRLPAPNGFLRRGDDACWDRLQISAEKFPGREVYTIDDNWQLDLDWDTMMEIRRNEFLDGDRQMRERGESIDPPKQDEEDWWI